MAARPMRSAAGPEPRTASFRDRGKGSGDMTDLATALALVLVLEGLLWALSPAAMKRAAALALTIANEQLRIGGVLAAALGVGLLWLLRS
jgi:uncharacterized protein YjeT (DUF2065 family)